jgi:hypothetical protein
MNFANSFIHRGTATAPHTGSNTEKAVPLIVTAIEAGPLEKEVRLLVESLRRWGGRCADARVIAVQPRGGPSPSPATRLNLDRLNVEYCQIERDDRFDWFPFLNKTAAVRHVAARHQGPIAWLDGDILVLSEPTELLFEPNKFHRIQFAACASDKNIGTTRDDDEFAPYFRAACQAVGVDFDSLPYVLTEKEQIYVRAYWNAGVFAFVGECGLAELYDKFTLTLLSKGIGSHECEFLMSDQVALALAAHHLGLRRKNLPLSHNFHVQPSDPSSLIHGAANNICVLHYHGCLWPSSFGKLCSDLELHYPEVARWLQGHGPHTMTNLSTVARIRRKLFSLRRKLQKKKDVRRARLY